MSEETKALARRFYQEVVNEKRFDVIDELCTPDFVDHSPMPGQAAGSQGLKEIFGSFFGEGFPDARLVIEEMIAEGDLVSTLFNISATHSGAVLGAPATGKRVTFHALDLIRIRGDRASEAWHFGDEMEVLMGLGVQPPA